MQWELRYNGVLPIRRIVMWILKRIFNILSIMLLLLLSMFLEIYILIYLDFFLYITSLYLENCDKVKKKKAFYHLLFVIIMRKLQSYLVKSLLSACSKLSYFNSLIVWEQIKHLKGNTSAQDVSFEFRLKDF